MKKIVSLCLTAVMMLAALSACANPPGEGSTTVKNPPAAASQSGKVTEAPQPVDLSVLSEDELGKIDEKLLEELKAANKNDILRIDISLCPVISSQEAQDEAHKRLDTGKVEAEMIDELNRLNDQLASRSLSNEERASVKERASELRKALENNSILYRQTVGKVLDETNGAALNKFIEDYGIVITDETDVCSTTMRITFVNMSAQKIIETAKDKKVVHLKSINNGIVFEQAINNNINSSDALYSNPYSTTKVNEIYDIIDGEFAV